MSPKFGFPDVHMPVQPIDEFDFLRLRLPESLCAKKQTAAGTYVDGKFFYATNSCEFEGDSCPRLDMPSGIGYELCKSTHAEATLVAELRRMEALSDGVLWLVGHYWACEPCANAAKQIGVRELRIMEVPWKRL